MRRVCRKSTGLAFRAMLTDAGPRVSVIVPVRDDTLRLAGCLQALTQQDYPVEKVELIVVDNGSRESPAHLVGRFPAVQWLQEPRPAEDRARNTGVRASHGEVLGFTDSDCIPDSGWIRQGVRAVRRSPAPGLVAGRIDVTARDPQHPSLAEWHDLVLAFPQERCVHRSQYGATANLFTTRSTFEAVGPFSEVAAGDAEWGQRVHRSGRPVVYDDAVRVSHPARATVAELVARTRRGARELAAWRRSEPLHILRDQLKDLVVPPDLLWKIATTPRLPNAWVRIQVLALFVGLRQVRFWERLRFLARGVPLR